MKQTPGTWEAWEHAPGEWTVSARQDGKVIADVATVPASGDVSPEAAAANASLIAAAPEIATALTDLVAWATDPRLALAAVQVGMPGPDALIAGADRALAKGNFR